MTITADRPFLDWLHRVDPTNTGLGLEVYLAPEYDGDKEARRFLEKYSFEIFEEQLDGWFRVPLAWPIDRSFDTFVRWFE